MAIGFPSHLLEQDEQVILDMHPHWIMLAPAGAASVLLVAVGVAVTVMLINHGHSGQAALAMLGFAVVAVVVFGAKQLSWRYTHFVLTDTRIVTRVGIFAKAGVEIPVQRVNTVFFNQSIVERMIGVGNLSIESASASGATEISGIANPSGVQRAIYAQMEKSSGIDPSTGAPIASQPTTPLQQQPPPPSNAIPADIPEQINALAALYNSGALTESEFAAKKAELLSRI